MGNFLVKGGVLTGYQGDETEISVPEGVRIIGARAFSGKTSIRRVVLPPGVRQIRKQAFSYCSALREVVLPPGLKSIGEKAFAHCSAMEQVVLPDSLQVMGSEVFGCCSLTSVVVPGGIRELPRRTFHCNGSLKTVTLAEGVEVIGEKAFHWCDSLSHLKLPRSLRVIEREAFDGCYYLEQLTLPEGVTTIREATFRDCGRLRQLSLPESLEQIAPDCLMYCYALERVDVAPGNPRFWSREGMLVRRQGEVLLSCPLAGRRMCTIPEGVREITAYALSQTGDRSCSQLQQLSFPSTLERVTNTWSCFLMTWPRTLRVDGALEPLEKILEYHRGDGEVIADHIPISQAPSRLRTLLLTGYLNRKERGEEVPAGAEAAFLDYIRRHAISLWNRGLCRSVILEQGMIPAGRYLALFQKVNPQQEPDLAAALLEYRRKFFSHGEVEAAEARKVIQALRSATRGGETAAELRRIFVCRKTGMKGEEEMISYRGSAAEVEVPGTIGWSRVVAIAKGAFARGTWRLGQDAQRYAEERGKIRRLVLPEGIRVIGESAFAGLEGMEHIALPESLEEIRPSAFQGCIHLQSLTIPAGVAEICTQTFADCVGLETLGFSGMTSIRDPETALPARFHPVVEALPGSPAEDWAVRMGLPFRPLEGAQGE